MRAASRSGAAGKFPGSRRQARPVLLLAATLLLAACAPAGVWAWRPVALPSASRVAGLASLRQPAAAGCGAGCGLLRPWRLRSEGRPQRQLLPDASAAGGSYWSAWHVCRGTRRAAGILNAANEDPQAEPSAKRMLDALPLPLLPSPFNSTLVGLLGNTPSRWLPGASGDKDWSIAGSGTAAPSPAAPTYSSPGIPTAGRVRSRLQHAISKNTQRISVESSQQLQDLLQDGVSVYKMDIRGISLPGCQDAKGRLLSPTNARPTPDQQQHPVVAALQERRRTRSKPGARKDGYKIALAIEGGGLRGCVSAGMASALAHLGLEDSFDMVLGSSAGSIIGAYLVGRSTPQTTYQFFCNHLTTSKEHLDGASWLDVSRLVDLFRPKRSATSAPRPAMLLDYPMGDIMQRLCPLDWETFQANDKVQPMKVIAAGLLSEGAVSLGSQEGSFTDLASLCNCIKASCMLPGVAGVEPAWLTGSAAPDIAQRYKGVSSDEGKRAQGLEPMVDALVYEPIPYRTALELGATHVLVLRSYPDGTFLPKSLLGLFELVIAPKCLDPYPATKAHLATAGHSIIYAQDIVAINEAQRASTASAAAAASSPPPRGGPGSSSPTQTSAAESAPPAQAGAAAVSVSDSGASLFAVAPLDVDGEVSQLTLDRQTLLRGIMQGFARCYDLFEPQHAAPAAPQLAGPAQPVRQFVSAVGSRVSQLLWQARDALPFPGESSGPSSPTSGHGGYRARWSDAARPTGDEMALTVFLPLHYEYCQQLAAQGKEKGIKKGTQTITVSSTYAQQCQVAWARERDRTAALQREADERVRGSRDRSPARQDEYVLKIEKVGTVVPKHWQEGHEYVMGGVGDAQGAIARGFEKGDLVVLRRSSGELKFGSIEVLLPPSASSAPAGPQCIVRVESPYGPKQNEANVKTSRKGRVPSFSADKLSYRLMPTAELGKILAEDGAGHAPGSRTRMRKRDRLKRAWRRFRDFGGRE